MPDRTQDLKISASLRMTYSGHSPCMKAGQKSHTSEAMQCQTSLCTKRGHTDKPEVVIAVLADTASHYPDVKDISADLMSGMAFRVQDRSLPDELIISFATNSYNPADFQSI